MYAFIGDVHGQSDALQRLCRRIGRRQLIFVGDYVDKGPSSLGVLWQLRDLQKAGAVLLMGNHDYKLLRYLKGNPVKLTNGLADTVGEPGFQHCKDWIQELLESMGTHYSPEPGLVAVHGGWVDPATVSASEFRSRCFYGETDGTLEDDGFPKRVYQWRHALQKTTVVHGHDAHGGYSTLWTGPDGSEAWNIDSGACLGFGMSALLWPERRVIYEPNDRVN